MPKCLVQGCLCGGEAPGHSPQEIREQEAKKANHALYKRIRDREEQARNNGWTFIADDYRRTMPEAFANAQLSTPNDDDAKAYTICCDFDGVVHSYTSGWRGACEIPDPPVPGAYEWLTELFDRREEFVNEKGRNKIQLCIYSSRSKFPGAIESIQAWFRKNGLSESVLGWIQFPTQKPAASMTIDDRAFCFEGDFPSPEWMLRFIPWNKRRR